MVGAAPRGAQAHQGAHALPHALVVKRAKGDKAPAGVADDVDPRDCVGQLQDGSGDILSRVVDRTRSPGTVSRRDHVHAALANAYLVSNLVYQEYPSVGSFYPVPVAASVDAHQFTSMKSPPKDHGREVGALVTLSAAPMRDAVAYVPPAYWRNHDLPVLVITAGSPGSPMDWFTKGDAAQSLDDFQSRHNGEAPVVVSVDATGSETGNPACSDGPEHKVLTYISTQVPEMIKANFDVNDDQSRWTVGGLSYGGTCAMQVITNHPEAYGSVLDFSGEAEPNVGSHAETVQEIFGGSEEAFQKVNAATLLDKARGTSYYDGIVGRFVAGEDDEMSTAALSHLNDLARAAGMDTTYDTVPGSHSYQVWRVAFRDNLDFVAERGGLK